jgi:hypothetical protein
MEWDVYVRYMMRNEGHVDITRGSPYVSNSVEFTII